MIHIKLMKWSMYRHVNKSGRVGMWAEVCGSGAAWAKNGSHFFGPSQAEPKFGRKIKAWFGLSRVEPIRYFFMVCSCYRTGHAGDCSSAWKLKQAATIAAVQADSYWPMTRVDWATRVGLGSGRHRKIRLDSIESARAFYGSSRGPLELTNSIDISIYIQFLRHLLVLCDFKDNK